MVLLFMACWLLLPKLMVIDWAKTLWIHYSPLDTLRVLREDALLSAVVFIALRRLLPGASRARYGLCAVSTALLLVLMMLEARARQLWLHPVDATLLKYAQANYRDLSSGIELFFNYDAGWNMTFRRSLVLVVGLYGVCWALLAWRGSGLVAALARTLGGQVRWVRGLGLPVAVLLPPLVASVVGGDERYRMGSNVLVHPAVAWCHSDRKAEGGASERFDQKPQPAPAAAFGERRILGSVRPFKNLVLLFYESVRWKDLHLDQADTPCPNLARLASEGLLSISYVPVPHSSKAYYAVLTGRYPYPGIEMREAMTLRHDSFVRSLVKRRPGTQALAFTSMHLAFENTDGLLGAVGIDRRLEVQDLAEQYQVAVEEQSSFGRDDQVLYDLTTRYLAAARQPFLAVLLPLAAHYPYEYPGKPTTQGSSHAAYLESLVHSDRLLGGFVDLLVERGLATDTLLVIVGDHGESFGEHGVRAHNSSLYGEETTVPLVLWSADGRLQYSEIIRSRQIDIGPTVLDLFGITNDRTPVQGRSLLRTEHLPPLYMSTFFDDLALGLLEYPYKFVFEPAAGNVQRFDLGSDGSERRPTTLRGRERAIVISRLRSFQSYQRGVFSR